MEVQRSIKTAIDELIGKYPVIALTGPRQSGKTTLLKKSFFDYQYVNLEDPEVREFAISDPKGFFKIYSDKTIIDEAQRVPSLFSYIQSIVDESGKMGQYIISGSQNFQLMENITQSLAGRVAIFQLLPFDLTELESVNLLNDDYATTMVNGFYPALYDRQISPSKFYYNYIQTYVQRDITELIEVKNLNLFKKFIKLVAGRVGQLINYNSLAKDCGVSQPTIKSWISALESSYILFTLPPYFENISKRLIKTPKLYFYDTGLLCHLLGIKEADEIRTHPLKGNLFENMMISEYIKRMHHKNDVMDVWFWRDVAGHEIDFLTKKGGTFSLYEIKSTETIMPNQFKGLSYFESIHPYENNNKNVVYAGTDTQERTLGRIIPWKNFGDNA